MPEGQKAKDQANELNVFLSIFSEFLFVLLPLVVITIVMLHKGNDWWKILSSVEWSFGSAILFGQSIVKFVSGTTKSGSYIWERVAIIVAIIVVVLLVPTLIILALILVSENPSTGLVWSQVVFFLLSCFAFLIVGRIGHSEIVGHS